MAMHQQTTDATAILPASRVQIDAALRQKIDAAVGRPIRFDSAVLIQEDTRKPQIVVVVVERSRFPTDDELGRIFNLTTRECQVARLLAERLSDEEIAHRLNIKLNTARCHSCRVLGKLGVHTRNDVRTVMEGRDASSKRLSERNVA